MSILPPAFASSVLDYLGVERSASDLSFLDRLVAAYVRTVPWESASRIVRRARISSTADCPHWPEEFWRSAMQHGTGGTCFESNYAFFSLLSALGYDGYLTINDMGQTIGCHTAIIVRLDAQRWLVDVGLPLYIPLPLDHEMTTQRTCSLMRYTVHPSGGDRYEIERAPHPKPICFTLVDKPVDDASYRAATTADYHRETGLFLHEVIVNKVVGEQIWRFTNREGKLEHFSDGLRGDDSIEGDAADAIARQFGITAAIVREAMTTVRLRGGP